MSTKRPIDGYAIDTVVIDGGEPVVLATQNSSGKATQTSAIKYTYSDFLFTMAFDEYGTPIIKYDFDCINQSIQMILSTSPGERIMLPNFGCNINSYVFEPCTPLNARLLELDIRDALVTYENRIIVTSVLVTISQNQKAFYININYSLATTGQPSTYQAQLQTQSL